MKARFLLVVFVLALAGCVAGPATSPGAAQRVRCLYDPNERETRPLILLLCIQNP